MCNLHCKHCFWVRDKHLYPTKTQDVLENVKTLLKKFPSITNILWYGGEPLLNETTKNILVEGFKLLKRNNVVITNGTIPLPAYKKNGVKYGISIDGTEELHDQMRGKNVYKKIKKNIKEGLDKGIDISINYCINSQNINCIPEFLEEWHQTGINKIYFTMYVPEKDDTSGLELSDSQMIESSLLLMEIKKKYPIVGNSYKMIELLHPKYGKQLAKNCFMNVNLSSKKKSVTTLHLAYDGTIKTPCTYGTDETCEKCRSITHVALYASKVLKDRESLYMLLDGYHKTSK